MKKITVLIVLIYAVFFTLAAPCWAQAGKISGLVGLDAALDSAVKDIESKLPKGTPIIVAAIAAPGKDARDYIADELSGRFKNLKTLAREAALKAVEKEQEFQLSGMVSDESAVGIGHFIGAKAVITGDMRHYADFTQLRVRIVDVETSQAFIYSAKIANNDRLLTNILSGSGPSASVGSKVKVSDIALDHLNRGNDYLAEKKYDEALREFEQAIAADNKFSDAYTGRGMAYYWKNNNERAVTEFNQAIKINPNDAKAYNGRGLTYYLMSQNSRAIADFTKAIKIDPNYVEAYSGRGDVYYDKEDYDRAIADYTSAIQIDPNHPLMQFVYADRGHAYSYKKDYDRAIADFTAAIQIRSNFSPFFSFRGHAYYYKKDYDRAIADFTSAIRIKPDRDNYSSRALVYENKGDIDRAIADYTAAINIKPDWWDYDRRAKLYEKKGDLDHAIDDYENYMRLLGSYTLKPYVDNLRKQRGR